MLHCTTKFCDYGKATGAEEYAQQDVSSPQGHPVEVGRASGLDYLLELLHGADITVPGEVWPLPSLLTLCYPFLGTH